MGVLHFRDSKLSDLLRSIHTRKEKEKEKLTQYKLMSKRSAGRAAGGIINTYTQSN